MFLVSKVDERRRLGPDGYSDETFFRTTEGESNGVLERLYD